MTHFTRPASSRCTPCPASCRANAQYRPSGLSLSTRRGGPSIQPIGIRYRTPKTPPTSRSKRAAGIGKRACLDNRCGSRIILGATNEGRSSREPVWSKYSADVENRQRTGFRFAWRQDSRPDAVGLTNLTKPSATMLEPIRPRLWVEHINPRPRRRILFR